MVKTLLWLDDQRNPLENNWLVFSPIEQPFEVIWVKTYNEFINWIKINGLPTAVCYDHDLGDNFSLREGVEVGDWFSLEENREYTGMDCAKWLVNYCLDNDKKMPLYNIQSANPVGKDNIDGLLKNFNLKVHGIK